MRATLKGPGNLTAEIEMPERPEIDLPAKVYRSLSSMMAAEELTSNPKPSFVRLRYRNTYKNNVYEFEGVVI